MTVTLGTVSLLSCAHAPLADAIIAAATMAPRIWTPAAWSSSVMAERADRIPLHPWRYYIKGKFDARGIVFCAKRVCTAKVLPIAISLLLPGDRWGRPSGLPRGARSVTVGTRCNRANAVPQSHRSSAPSPPAQAGRGGLCAYPRSGAPFLHDARSGRGTDEDRCRAQPSRGPGRQLPRLSRHNEPGVGRIFGLRARPCCL